MAASPCRWALIAHSPVLPPHFLTMGRQRSERSAAFLAALSALQHVARIRSRTRPLARPGGDPGGVQAHAKRPAPTVLIGHKMV
jgi:hypothetical protein